MKKFVLTISIIILILIAALTFATISYSKTSDYQSDVFPENTTINGVDCSGLTYQQASAELSQVWNDRSIVITGNLNEQITSFTDFGCTYAIDDELADLKSNYKLLAAVNHYLHTPLSVNIPMIISDYSESFKKTVVSSDFLNKGTATISKDAYVDLSDPSFPIIPEVYGTKADSEKFFNDLLHHIETGDISFIFDERDYYTMPEVTADDETLLEYQAYCQKYLKQKISYMLGAESFSISTEQLSKLLKEDLSGQADQQAVAEYVAELAQKYDNIGIQRNFTSLTGRKISVSGGTYGWQIDQEKETAQLISDINRHKDVARSPVFSVEGYGEYSNDLGDTYIDVDISNQLVSYYKDGELSFSSSCVTGCRATGTTTDTGTYYILNQVRDVVLRGDNADGSEYESPVKYWLGVTWTGQGFHDADWRTTFGGSIWINNGSHGCINMPPKLMPKLYNSVEVGTPVVMHY